MPISLVTIALAFISGLLANELFSFFPVLTTLTLLLFLRFYKEERRIKIAVFIICSIGFVFPHIPPLLTHAEDLDQLINGSPMRIVAYVNGPPLRGPDRVILQMQAESYLTEDEKSRPLHGLFRVTIQKPETSIAYGDLLEMNVTLHPPRQFGNPGVFQSADYLKRQGLVGTAFLSNENEIRKIEEKGNPFLKIIYRYRDEIRKKIVSDVSSPTGPILLAMILGETGYLNDLIRDAFTNSGTNHILSISGSHLAMVSFFIFGFSRWIILRLPASMLLRASLFKIPSQWAALITAIAVTLYTLLSGSQVATLRSLAMILAYLFALWIGRSVSVLRSISLAALLILILQPQTIFNISFQLSFLAILFIVLVSEYWNNNYPNKEPKVGVYKWIRPLLLLLISSLGATIGTAPLTLYYFHQFSWVGLIANFIVIPYTGFVLLPLGFVCALVAPFLSHFPLASLNEAIGSFYFNITSFFASFPGADAHFSSPHLLLVILSLVILATLLKIGGSPQLLAGTVCAFFFLFLGMGYWRLPPISLRVTFIDVGQGDSALIEFPGGKTLLVDAGSGWPFDMGKAVVSPFLWERKIRTIDYLVGTHPQMDHIGGFPYLIKNFKIGTLLTDGITPSIPFYQSLLQTAKDKGITPRGVSRMDAPILVGGCQIVFLSPFSQPSPDEKDLNNHSIVFRLSCPSLSSSSFLFTGDIEKKAMRAILQNNGEIQSDILKVPHHGSKGSLEDQFISRVRPKIAIFSVGERNRYRHPSPKAIAAYEKIGAKNYRTDQDGAIVVTLRQDGLFIVKSFREGKMNKVQWDRTVLMQEIKNLRNGFSME